jgi:hypothetical protein
MLALGTGVAHIPDGSKADIMADDLGAADKV